MVGRLVYVSQTSVRSESGSGGDGRQGHIEAEGLQGLHGPPLYLLLVAVEEVVSAEIGKDGFRIIKQVIDDGQDGMGDGKGSSLGATPGP